MGLIWLHGTVSGAFVVKGLDLGPNGETSLLTKGFDPMTV